MNEHNPSTTKSKTRLAELAGAYDPWPLGTDAMLRILAWPDYRNPTQIQKILQASSRLFGHDDACLILRYDAAVDGPINEVIQLLDSQLKQRTDSGELQILIVDDEIPESQWYRVGLTAFCSVGFKDAPQNIRTRFIDAQRSEKIFV